MITNLKHAKARLSELVEQAARGEEVVITVRGKAKARLCGIGSDHGESPLEGWGRHLEEARQEYRGTERAVDSQRLWDELRGD